MIDVNKFWEELKRRRVVRALLSWAVFLFSVLQVADLTFEPLGVSDWVLRTMIVLGISGFPVVACLAWMFDLPEKPRRLVVTSTLLFLIIGVSVSFYLFYNPTEPVQFVAHSDIPAGSEILLAEISNPDQGLSNAFTEALRIGLSSSPQFKLIEPTNVRRALARMERAPNSPLDETIARELALREGAEAYLTGTIGMLGNQFLLVTHLVNSADDRVLASFRETTGEADLIEGIDRLADQIRRSLGESLATIEAREPLNRVTTNSLEALRYYASGVNAFRNGEAAEAVIQLKAAIAEDPEFASAWSFMGPALQSSGSEEEEFEAIKRSFKLRDRLPFAERLNIERLYHDSISGNVEAKINAMERILELSPDDSVLKGQLGRAYGQHYADFERAAKLMNESIAKAQEFASMSNIVWVNILLSELDAADQAATAFSRIYETSFWRHRGHFFVHYFRNNTDEAWVEADALMNAENTPERWRSRALFYRSLADTLAGRGNVALENLRNEIKSQTLANRHDLAAARWSDLIWLQGVVLGEYPAAIAEAENLLNSELLDYSDNPEELYFRVVRDASRVGATATAQTVLERWQAHPPDFNDWGREEDMQAATALLEGAKGNYSGAIASLEELMSFKGPRYTQREWPSARHCQRCWRFDIGRLYAEAGLDDQAASSFRQVLLESDEIVEQPLNRIIASDWLRRKNLDR